MDNLSVKNVIVFGETGSGKSSVVNMILGREAAEISDSAIGCTFSFQHYSYTADTGIYDLYDTVGLSEGSSGTVTAKDSITSLIRLLKKLKDGVSLLVFVIEKGRIKKSMEENYKLFVKAICMDQVPVMLVVTHCEMEVQMGDWWAANQKHFDKYDMKFLATVSGCATRGHGLLPTLAETLEARYMETQKTIRAAISQHGLVTPWRMKGWLGWFQKIYVTVCNIILGWFKLPKIPFFKDLCDFLMKSGIEREMAVELANDVAAEL